MRQIGLAALTVLELPHHEQVQVAAQAGYTHIGLRLVPVAGQAHSHPFDVPTVQGALADSGIRVYDMEVFRLEAGTRVADFEWALEISQRLGASEILVHGADPDVSRLTETFGELCDLAGRYRLAANLEPMPWVDVSNVTKAMQVLDGAGRSNGRLLVDAIHFYRGGDAPGVLKSVPRSMLRYAQFCDARRGTPTDMQEMIRQARGDRLFPGEGGLDLRGLLRELPPELPLSLEVPYARPMPALERAKRALEATRGLLA